MFALVTERQLQNALAPIEERLRKIAEALFEHEYEYLEDGSSYRREGVVKGLNYLRLDLAHLIARLSTDLDIPHSDYSCELQQLLLDQVARIRRHRESIEAALYRDLPDECKNGHKKEGKR